MVKMVNQQLSYINPDLKTLVAYLPNCRFGTAKRCLLTARLFGDDFEICVSRAIQHICRGYGNWRRALIYSR